MTELYVVSTSSAPRAALRPPQDFLTFELCNPAPSRLLLWCVRFNSSLVEAYLHHVGEWGVAYRLYLNGRFIYSERFVSEEKAREAADGELARRVGEGWVHEPVRKSA